jgi:hypothetical protein
MYFCPQNHHGYLCCSSDAATSMPLCLLNGKGVASAQQTGLVKRWSCNRPFQETSLQNLEAEQKYKKMHHYFIM